MSFKLKIAVCLSGIFLCVGFAKAQTSATQSEYNSVQSKYDCSRATIESNEGIIRGIRNNSRESEERSRKEALIAARDAVARGYNYALMRPWSRRDYTKVVVDKGVWFDMKAEFKKSKFNLACKALPDQAAYDFMWGEKVIDLEAASETALIDLRKMIKTLDPGDDMRDYRTRKAAAEEKSFKRPGERETYIKQIAIKQASADCFKNHTPVSALQFKRQVSAQERSAREACIKNLNSQAQAVGWNDHPGLVSDRNTTLNHSGYTVNRPTETAVNGASSPPAHLWGEGWIDLTANYPNIDGIFMATTDGGTIMIASNTMPQDALLDHAVYYAAKTNMHFSYSGIRVVDRTTFYRDSFDKKISERNKKIQKDSQSSSRDNAANDRDIAKLRRYISQEEDSIRRAEEDMEVVRAYGSDIPQYNLIVKRHEQEKERRTEKIAAYRVDIAQLQSTTVSTPETTKSRPMPSQTISGEHYKGAYYLFEQNYKNVLIFNEDYIAGSCDDDDLVCADKLQAHNVLGPRLNVVDHQALSPPVGYKPFDSSK